MRSTGFDGNGESLVEGGIAIHIEALMRQFMEDKACQIGVILTQHGA